MTKFRPPSWAEPEPGEDTVEICYTDGETTKELHLPLSWRLGCSSFRVRQAFCSAWASISWRAPTRK